MIQRLLGVLLIALMVLPLVVQAQDDETIVIRGFGNIVTFNPALSSDGASTQAFALMFPLPFETDRFTGEPIPGLTTYTISDDGLTYTFTIRDDAFWSDGVPITSADMKFVIDAVKREDIASVYRSNVRSIEAVNIIDDKTYEIVLANNNCAALTDIGGIRFLPSHKFAADFSDFMDSPFNQNPDVSGGPYILEEWVPDEFQRFRANPTYWRGEVPIPNLVNRVIGGQAQAILSIQSGEIDYTYFQGDLFEQIADRSRLQWEIYPQFSVNFMSLNWADPNNPQPAYDEDGNLIEQTPHPLFSDVRVRKAVAMGYNKADILATLGGPDGGTPLIGFVHPSITWAYNTDLSPYPYDPDAARALLDEAGWIDTNGDGIRECVTCTTAEPGTPLAFTITYSDILQFFETTALVAADQLGDIGFDVQLRKVEWANYITDIYFGQQYDATPMSNSGGAGGPPDPNFFSTLIRSTTDIPGSGNNLSSYVNPEVDRLLEEALRLPGCDLAARGEIYREIQRILHEDVAYDWTFVPNIWQTANVRVQGFRPGPSWVFYGYTSWIHEWSLGE
ncbi:MAG: ABC transporter substrate-binding protein [Anaerolineae bacterium]